jgi:hypothetical protein
MPAIYVKPFVKGQKNDYNDADLQTHVCAMKGPWSPKVILCVVLGRGV